MSDGERNPVIITIVSAGPAQSQWLAVQRRLSFQSVLACSAPVSAGESVLGRSLASYACTAHDGETFVSRELACVGRAIPPANDFSNGDYGKNHAHCSNGMSSGKPRGEAGRPTSWRLRVCVYAGDVFIYRGGAIARSTSGSRSKQRRRRPARSSAESRK